MRYAVRLAKRSGTRIIAIDWDVSPDGATLARRHDIAVLRADGQALPLADRSVDRILMSSLLHMVPDPERLLAECWRVLKPDGYLVLSTPNHYQFIPDIFRSKKGGALKKVFRLPSSYAEMIALLNKRFGVGGPRGYYAPDELAKLLETCYFQIEEHRYAPGWVGSLLWELGVLAYVRFGNMAFHLLFIAYPAARLCDILAIPKTGSEHIVKAFALHGK